MGYPSNDARITEGNVDDGHSSAMFDAQFKPSSSNLPALGTSFIARMDAYRPPSNPWNLTPIRPPTRITPAPVSAPIISGGFPVAKQPFVLFDPVAPYTPPPPTIVSPSNPAPIIASSPPPDYVYPVTPFKLIPNPTSAQDNSNTLVQQAQQAATNGNTSLAKSLTDQAINWQQIANGLFGGQPGANDGKSINPLSADPGVPTGPVKAGLLGSIKPQYLLIAAAAALFLSKK